MDRTDLEQFVDALNASVFMREFTFSRTKFRPEPHTEKEFADHAVCIDNTWILYQTKGRRREEDTAEARRKWFKREVIGRATKQIRDTLTYIEECDEIRLQNDRGHTFNIVSELPATIHKVVVYDPGTGSSDQGFPQHHVSRTAGFIHLVDAAGYLNVCNLLVTPAEVWEYLAFREQILSKWNTRVREKSLFGQFLQDRINEEPTDSFANTVDRLVRDQQSFDIRHLTTNYLEHTYSGNEGSDYYPVIAELAKLNRAELRPFKERLQLCLDGARDNKLNPPYRMLAPRTGCGFVFITLPQDLAARRVSGLKNLTIAAKHTLKADRQVGVCVSRHGESDVNIDWVYIQYPWRDDPALDQMLSANDPFLRVSEKGTFRYHLRDVE